MKNVIEYFYKIKIDTIRYSCDKYYISSDNSNYLFQRIDKYFNFKVLQISQFYIFFHKIVFNFKGNLVTSYENSNFILFKINLEKNRVINFNDIINIMNLNLNLGFFELNWDILWENKIDRFENYIINKDLKFYLRDYYDYFIGLGEIAITYYRHAKKYPVKYGFTYNRINKKFTLYDLYNPLNIVISSPIKGIAEYIKENFFIGKPLEIETIGNLNLNYDESILLISRLIFPTYFFDLFNSQSQINSVLIEKIITLIPKYENYLSEIIDIIKKEYNDIPLINWIVF